MRTRRTREDVFRNAVLANPGKTRPRMGRSIHGHSSCHLPSLFSSFIVSLVIGVPVSYGNFAVIRPWTLQLAISLPIQDVLLPHDCKDMYTLYTAGSALHSDMPVVEFSYV